MNPPVSLDQLTLNEKISLLSGSDFWHTADITRHGISKLRMSDGPNGIRGTRFFKSVPASCLPCGTALGALWDTALLQSAGHLIARECVAKSAHVWLGPTVNIQRSPLGGRCFESFSEDPMLSGLVAATLIEGVQQSGIASAIKHFVANDMEHQRTSVNCVITDRALREIYLLPFQLAMRNMKPWALMTAYNRVNGTHMSEHQSILQDIVRNEWEYDGCIVSDWYGTYSTSESINAGLDIEMPGPTAWRGKNVAKSVGIGKIKESTIDDRVSSVLRLMERCATSGIPASGPEVCLDTQTDRELLKTLASESIVLLKNEGGLLPFCKTKKTAVIGPNAHSSYYCGGGSASLRPYRAVSIYDGVEVNTCAKPPSAEGCQVYNALPTLSKLLRSPEGRKGFFTMKVFKDPLGSTGNIPVETFDLDDTFIVLYDYTHPSIENDVLYALLEADLEAEESSVYEFGVTVAGTAKLFLDDQLVVDNSKNQLPGESFFGSGTLEKTNKISLEAGRRYRFRVEFGSAATSDLVASGSPVFGAGGVRIGCAKVSDPELELKKAVEIAKQVDQVVLCVGLGPDWEAEGSDRTTMALPGLQNDLIKRVCSANPNTVVVIQSGTPVSGPWQSAPAILQSWYGGNECGLGIADVIFGNQSPSGKLPLSWPKTEEDTPCFLSYRSEAGKCHYTEGIFVGYRYYEKVKREVEWPFGYGLSYASFGFSELGLDIDIENPHGQLQVNFKVTNQSQTIDASEVCQLYIQRVSESRVSHPAKELKGFTKVFIQADDTQLVSIQVPLKYAISFWDEVNDTWVMESGTYRALIGNSSAHIALSQDFQVANSHSWRGL